MLQLIRNETQNDIKVFVCDHRDELSDISLRTTSMGSTCYVIDEEATYILNGSYNWVKKASSGSGSSSSTDSQGNTYVMDGGVI